MSDFTEAELTVMLRGLYAIKHQRDDLDKAYKKGSQPVRDWLDLHPGDFLRDGETGIVAKYQERNGPEDMDVIGLAQERPELCIDLAKRGCLRLDNGVWKALQGKTAAALDAAGFLMSGKGSVALLIEKEEA